MDNRKISLCIPVYNRFELLLESFDKVKEDPKISEICIYSDGSNREYSNKLYEHFQYNPKVELWLNPSNQGVHIAKKKAVELATNEWIILFDSDNVIDEHYLNCIYYREIWDKYIAYQPSYLAPHFDFSNEAGTIVNQNNLKFVLDNTKNRLNTWGNAQNFFINKKTYLDTWEEGKDVNGNDSLWFFYLLMKKGYSMELVPNLSYFHRVDNHSNEQKGNYNSDRMAGMKIEQTMNLIRQLAK